MPDAESATPPPERGALNAAIAANVRAVLARDQVSASELARRIGLSTATVSRLLSGDVQISGERLIIIAEALRMRAHELLPEGHSCTAGLGA